MKQSIFTANEEKVLEIQAKIKKFTQEKPSDRGMADPDYKGYLAQCSELYALDTELSNLVNLGLEPEDLHERLLKVEKKLEEIVAS